MPLPKKIVEDPLYHPISEIEVEAALKGKNPGSYIFRKSASTADSIVLSIKTSKSIIKVLLTVSESDNQMSLASKEKVIECENLKDFISKLDSPNCIQPIYRNFFDQLPMELQLIIFENFTKESLKSSVLVSKHWRELVKEIIANHKNLLKETQKSLLIGTQNNKNFFKFFNITKKVNEYDPLIPARSSYILKILKKACIEGNDDVIRFLFEQLNILNLLSEDKKFNIHSTIEPIIKLTIENDHIKCLKIFLSQEFFYSHTLVMELLNTVAIANKGIIADYLFKHLLADTNVYDNKNIKAMNTRAQLEALHQVVNSKNYAIKKIFSFYNHLIFLKYYLIYNKKWDNKDIHKIEIYLEAMQKADQNKFKEFIYQLLLEPEKVFLHEQAVVVLWQQNLIKLKTIRYIDDPELQCCLGEKFKEQNELDLALKCYGRADKGFDKKDIHTSKELIQKTLEGIEFCKKKSS